MVRVELYQSHPGELTGFRAVGHAGYAPPGEDIVCAGVSAVTQACVLGLKDHLELPVTLKAEDGLLECRLPREIPKEKRDSARAILETMVLALREIEKGHGRYFALISLDAPRSSRGRTRGGRRVGRPEGGRKQAAVAAESQPQEREARGSREKWQAPKAHRHGDEGRPGKSSRRRRSEPAGPKNGVPGGQDDAPALRPGVAPQEEDRRPAPQPVEPPKPEPEPEGQVAVAQEPAPEAEKRSVLNPFRRKRLRSFKPGRLGRRWRP